MGKKTGIDFDELVYYPETVTEIYEYQDDYLISFVYYSLEQIVEVFMWRRDDPRFKMGLFSRDCFNCSEEKVKDMIKEELLNDNYLRRYKRMEECLKDFNWK